jgi:hypothetical protein
LKETLSQILRSPSPSILAEEQIVEVEAQPTPSTYPDGEAAIQLNPSGDRSRGPHSGRATFGEMPPGAKTASVSAVTDLTAL